MRTMCDLFDLPTRCRLLAAAAVRLAWTSALVVAVNAALGLVMQPAWANANLAKDGRATSALDFAIIIPPILRILENSHPSTLVFDDSGLLPGSPVTQIQKIVLISTLRSAVCMELRLVEAQIANWQVRLGGSAGVRIETTEGGYRLCTQRAGRYELALQHDFYQMQGRVTNINWPVSLSMSNP